ncbi:MAG: sulfotransferase family protein [Actinomycetota bacterium]|nr:sulfotransferase family protein [Actinomycetota bacterium]
MALRVVGAGVGRTGTESLKIALEHLLGGGCYHMLEVFGRPDDIPVWLAAARGQSPDWDEFLADYVAAVDWPSAAFWRELSEAYPGALVLLSVRDADAWWTSASNTIFSPAVTQRYEHGPFPPGWPHSLLTTRFTPEWQNEDEAKAAYLRHNDEVRDRIAPGRLLEWRPGDGWEPICAALGVPVPDQPFPHANTTAMFQARLDQRGNSS